MIFAAVQQCWAPKGVRPDVACQLIREFTYLYGAVCPKDWTCVFLILPAADTECFQIFLNTLAKKYSRSALKSMDAVYDKLEEATIYIERNRKIVKSIASFPYIVKSS
jgi:hypothetical protein